VHFVLTTAIAMTKNFWIIETPRSIIDPSLHRHIIFSLSKPDGYVAGPFPREGDAIEWLNTQGRTG
jgi:hypothetical protein